MKISEHLKIEIKNFLECYQEIERNYDEIYKLFTPVPGCKFAAPIFKLSDLYLKNLDDRLSEGEWLKWFVYENELGKKALKVFGSDKKGKKIKTIEDLYKFLEKEQ